MPSFKLRRCDRCYKFHASYTLDDPQRGRKIYLCYDCWSAENRGLQPGTPTIDIRSVLANLPKKVSKLDLQILLAHLLGQPRAWVLAHPEAALTDEQRRALEAAVGCLRRGVPLPYVLERWEFFGLEFILTPDVLIPRPETELLVETALSWMRQPGSAIRNCIDIGTGSGCIAVSLAVNAPCLAVNAPSPALTATDISPAAIAVAHANAEKHSVADRIEFHTSDLFETAALEGRRFDLLAANLPYIPSWTLRQLEVYDHEPALALDGGADGLALIRRLLQTAPPHIAAGGGLLLEIEASQGNSALALARSAFPQADTRLLHDLAGHDRLLTIQT
jgi:release factor glutamine methyltransferase